MKLLAYLSCLFLVQGCIFTSDLPRDYFFSFGVYNYSDKAIYVSCEYGNIDSLPLSPKLVLFEVDSFNHATSIYTGEPLYQVKTPYFYPPEYRIEAYRAMSLFEVYGNPNKFSLPQNAKEITLFFITEQTMRNYDWEYIYKKQLFAKRVVLTEEELNKIGRAYVYLPQKESRDK